MTVLLLVGSTALVRRPHHLCRALFRLWADTSSSLPAANDADRYVYASGTAPSSTSADPLAPRHIDHDGLSAALPIAAQFGWLPASTLEENDSDLTSRLEIGDCSGQGAVTPSREDAATNRRYTADQDSLATVTFYDVAKAILRRRPDFEAKIDAIDERMDHDLRIRTRITRLEPPEAIVNTIGERPAPGSAARQWDAAAGRVAQHQAAFDISDGLGRCAGAFDRNAYSESRAVAEGLVSSIHHPIKSTEIERESPCIEL